MPSERNLTSRNQIIRILAKIGAENNHIPREIRDLILWSMIQEQVGSEIRFDMLRRILVIGNVVARKVTSDIEEDTRSYSKKCVVKDNLTAQIVPNKVSKTSVRAARN